MLQISVFLENRAGSLEGALMCVAAENIDIRAISLADTSDFGILRMIVDKRLKAEEALRKHNYVVGLTEVVVLELPDRPGVLLSIVKLLASENINIEYMYPFAGKDAVLPGMVFRFDKLDYAREILVAANFRELSET